jgi:hypothetical protein
MSSKIKNFKGLPPRSLLRYRDALTGSYPLIGRTGDERHGTQISSFLDNNIIIFKAFTGSVSNAGNTSNTFNAPIEDLTAGGGNHYTASSDLVAHYRFENNNADSSGVNISGLFSSSFGGSRIDPVYSGRTPFPGSKGAASFDGSTLFDTRTSGTFNFGDASNDSAFSVIAWINPSRIDGSTKNFPVFSKNAITSFEWNFWINTGSYLELELQDDTPSNVQRRQSSVSMNSFQGGWFHVAATYDGRGGSTANEGVKLYVNGDELDAVPNNQGTYVAMQDEGANGTIGARVSGPEAFANGLIDEVAVFGNKILSQNEIREIMGYRSVGQINYPSMLPAENISYYETELTTSMWIEGPARKGLGDQFLEFTPGENLTPFNESFRPEQSSTNPFYLTGSKSLGFSSRLASKTQIEFSFALDSSTRLLAQTASCYYFNNDLNKFELVAESELTKVNDIGQFDQLGHDAKMFGPFGNNVMSGTVGSLNYPSQFIGSTINSSLVSALSEVQEGSALINQAFEATSSQLNSVPINHPFLVEKAVIQFPLSASQGWLFDKTTTYFGAANQDAGGPCITFAIIRQEKTGDPRELILSATLIPSGDNVSYADTPKAGTVRTPQGFLSFATPTTIITNPADPDSFNGDVLLEAEATVSNGILASDSTGAGIGFGNARIAGINPFGRSMTTKPSGRSYFGKEFTMPQLSSDKILYSLENVINVFQYQKTAISPYLLLPGDRIIFSISKHRPVQSDPAGTGRRDVLTGSHDVWINSGEFKIKLYGSLIREQKEFHDTLNQPLNSNAIHEAIHFDNPVVDQFDVEQKTSFSGSYIDDYLTGSITVSEKAIPSGPSKRRVVFSKQSGGTNKRFIAPNGSLAGGQDGYANDKIPSFMRHVKIISNETFYDSLTPNIETVVGVSGGELAYMQDVLLSENPVIGSVVILDEDQVGVSADKAFVYSFPYEAKYSSISRVIGSFNTSGISTTNLSNGGSIDPIVDSKVTVSYRQPNSGFSAQGANTSNILVTQKPEFLGDIGVDLVPSIPDSLTVGKAIWGIGDGDKGHPKFISEWGASGNSTYVYGVECRGWKYGLKNGVSTLNSAIFRRDRYGQFRDMLEQRLYSKFVINFDEKGNPIEPTIGKSAIRVIFSEEDPEDTFSSNMSLEATSSLPYFDGVSRNRGDLPDTDIVP